MKTFIPIFLFFGITAAIAVVIEKNENTYKCRLSFCDTRPPVIVYVRSNFPPCNSQIETYRIAVPKYNGYLNVCNIEVIEQVK